MTVYVKPDENNYAFLRYVRWTIARHPAWENEPLADVDLVHVLMNPSEDRRVMQVSGRSPSRAVKLMQKVLMHHRMANLASRSSTTRDGSEKSSIY